MTIANVSATIAAAIASANVAADAASVVKFDGLVTFAATVALRVRLEAINTGSNLETDAKGRFVAVVDKSKDQRSALVAAFTKAGVKDKDAANIASMGRSLALFVVPLMIQDGSLAAAASGERMRQIIEETVLYLTHGKDTYNALERLRSNKWEPLPVEAPVVEADMEADVVEADMEATLDGPQEAEPASPPASAEDTLNAEVSNGVRALTAALERGDVERILAHGGAALALALGTALAEHTERLEAERIAAEIEASEAKTASLKGKKAA